MYHNGLGVLQDDAEAARWYLLAPELVNEVLDSIRQLAKDGMTMILVSHEMAFVREVADKVVFMDGGVVVEEGPPEQLFDTPKTDRARDFFRKILRH
jgi:polar amino acid transport system ATP-binding protein